MLRIRQQPLRVALLVILTFTIIYASLKLFTELYKHNRNVTNEEAGLRHIYVITPTYPRAEQLPELTRLGQTLMHVPAITWIVADDAEKTTKVVLDLLKRIPVRSVYLRTPMPYRFSENRIKPKGVSNRNGGLKWVREHAQKGVIYFADDDNTYDIRLFEEIRNTKRVSMFPVGLVTKISISAPIVKNGMVVDFLDGWKGNRKFPVDMAGFAFSVELLLENPTASMPYTPGYEESKFLQELDISKADIEPKADNCTQILVWHTKAYKNNPPALREELLLKYTDSNVPRLLIQLWPTET